MQTTMKIGFLEITPLKSSYYSKPVNKAINARKNKRLRGVPKAGNRRNYRDVSNRRKLRRE